MSDDGDIEASGLLDGLSGEPRAERAELIPWLLDQGITVEEIRASFAPMLLPARRALGDDGTYVSAREIAEQTGLEVDVLTRFQRASGLPLKKFFNTSGLKYKELGLSKKLPELSEDEQLKLLATDGMLVRRPLLIDGTTVLVGFKEAEWAARLRKED